MRNRLLCGVAAIAIVAATSGPLLAADQPVKARPAGVPPVVSDWTGWYLGGHLGYGTARYSGQWNPEGEIADFGLLRPKGLVGGLHGGYNWQAGSWLFGIEADISATGWSDRQYSRISPSHFFAANVDLLASIRGRLGMTFGRALVYATGGIAFTKGKGQLGSSEPDSDINFFKFNSIGGVVGGGIEWKHNPNLSFRLEVLHYFFNNSNAITTDFAPGDHMKLATATVVRGGFSYHFVDANSMLPGSLVTKAPVPSSAGWSGWYLGGHLGYGTARYSGQWNPEGEIADFGLLRPEGLVGGLHGGYNWQMGSWLVGIEADISATGWSDRKFSRISPSHFFDANVDLLASIRGRLGMTFGRALVYATGGIAFTKGKGQLGSSEPDSDINFFNFNSIGAVVGGGIAWKYNPNLSFRLEVLHYIFNKSNAITTDFAPGDHLKLTNTTVGRVGMTYHFGP